MNLIKVALGALRFAGEVPAAWYGPRKADEPPAKSSGSEVIDDSSICGQMLGRPIRSVGVVDSEAPEAAQKTAVVRRLVEQKCFVRYERGDVVVRGDCRPCAPAVAATVERTISRWMTKTSRSWSRAPPQRR